MPYKVPNLSRPRTNPKPLSSVCQHTLPLEVASLPESYQESAQFIVDNAIDVALSREHTVKAAEEIYLAMQAKAYSTETWSSHELHPKTKDQATLDFIFTMDLLNFCFWSESDTKTKFSVDYRGKRWTGYWSLVALLQRALDEGMVPLKCCGIAYTYACLIRSRYSNNVPILLGRWTNMLRCALESRLSFLHLRRVRISPGTRCLSTGSWPRSLRGMYALK